LALKYHGFFSRHLVVLVKKFRQILAQELHIREVMSATYKILLQGATDGEYIVITYITRFEKKENSSKFRVPMGKETNQILFFRMIQVC